MEFHEAANLFPLDDEHLEELTADIRANGQRVPIEILDGKIIDGRRRHMACGMAGVEPTFRKIETDDPIAYVLSLNLNRRHLTPSQKAMVAARAREMFDNQAKERQKRKPASSVPANLPEQTGDARDKAAAAVGVGGRSVDYATKVLTNGVPELAAAVDQGRMAVSTAAILSSEPAEVQVQEATGPRRARRYGPGAGGAREDAQEEPELPEGQMRGKGVICANEAINCLMRIPNNDRLRKRGFQIVTDWMRHNP
jgi:hypothetical protein